MESLLLFPIKDLPTRYLLPDEVKNSIDLLAMCTRSGLSVKLEHAYA
jgi:hypothetical protein